MVAVSVLHRMEFQKSELNIRRGGNNAQKLANLLRTSGLVERAMSVSVKVKADEKGHTAEADVTDQGGDRHKLSYSIRAISAHTLVARLHEHKAQPGECNPAARALGSISA